MRAVGLAIALTLFAAGIARAQTRWDLPAEERGWKLSLDEMTIKTDALGAARVVVVPPSAALRDGSARIGATIAAAWAASAGADGAAMLLAHRKQP